LRFLIYRRGNTLLLVRFQFSFWDSKFACGFIVRLRRYLSILFLRFLTVINVLPKRLLDDAFNSLFEIRFHGISAPLNRLGFQFSFWDSDVGLREKRRGRERTFNSLFEIQ